MSGTDTIHPADREAATGGQSEHSERPRLAAHYLALATDYDGTLAHDGVVDESTLDALRRARAAGLKLLLVSGRELVSLTNTFSHSELFDQMVLENGAILYHPATGRVELLSEPPPAALVAALEARHVPISVGHSVVATVEPHEAAVLDVIRELGLEWHIVFNKGSVMVLPSNVNKATGLAPALAALGIGPSDTIGVGDAENDHAFLKACGLSVAVANALPALKSAANLVTTGARGAGVTELIDRWLAGDLPATRPADA